MSSGRKGERGMELKWRAESDALSFSRPIVSRSSVSEALFALTEWTEEMGGYS